IRTPKALNNLAQGNTLGERASRTYPERVEYDFRGRQEPISPFRGERSHFIASFPRVLPWAKLFNAFGVRTEFSHRLYAEVVLTSFRVRTYCHHESTRQPGHDKNEGSGRAVSKVFRTLDTSGHDSRIQHGLYRRHRRQCGAACPAK